MDSIIQFKKECYFCGKQVGLENHHIFEGNPNRKLSEEYGLKVWLCHNCHNEPPYGVHFNKSRRDQLKDKAQVKCMEYYGWSLEKFIEVFGKNYLLEETMEELFL